MMLEMRTKARHPLFVAMDGSPVKESKVNVRHPNLRINKHASVNHSFVCDLILCAIGIVVDSKRVNIVMKLKVLKLAFASITAMTVTAATEFHAHPGFK